MPFLYEQSPDGGHVVTNTDTGVRAPVSDSLLAQLEASYPELAAQRAQRLGGPGASAPMADLTGMAAVSQADLGAQAAQSAAAFRMDAPAPISAGNLVGAIPSDTAQSSRQAMVAAGYHRRPEPGQPAQQPAPSAPAEAQPGRQIGMADVIGTNPANQPQANTPNFAAGIMPTVPGNALGLGPYEQMLIGGGGGGPRVTSTMTTDTRLNPDGTPYTMTPDEIAAIQRTRGAANDAMDNAIQTEANVGDVTQAGLQQHAQEVQRLASQARVAEQQQQARWDSEHETARAMLLNAANSSVNPTRALNASARIGGAIAIALGSIGSGINGQPNAAMEIINDAIDRDLKAQIADQENRLGAANSAQTLLARLEDRLGSADSARAMYRSLRLQEVADRIAAQVQGATTQDTAAKAQLLMANAEAAAAQAAAASRMAMAPVMHTVRKTSSGGGGRRITPQIYDRLLERQRQLAGQTAATPEQANAVTGAVRASTQNQVPPSPTGREWRIPGGARPTDSMVEAARKAAANGEVVRQAYNELIDLTDREGRALMIPGHPARARVNLLLENIASGRNQIHSANVMGNDEARRQYAATTDPSSLWTGLSTFADTASVVSRLRRERDVYGRLSETVLRSLHSYPVQGNQQEANSQNTHRARSQEGD